MSSGPFVLAGGGHSCEVVEVRREALVAVVRPVQHHGLPPVPLPLAVLPGRDRVLELVGVHLARHPPEDLAGLVADVPGVVEGERRDVRRVARLELDDVRRVRVREHERAAKHVVRLGVGMVAGVEPVPGLDVERSLVQPRVPT